MVFCSLLLINKNLTCSFAVRKSTMTAFFSGILLGFAITLSFGPGFIALFQTSLSRGLNAGILLATGMVLSDMALVCISYFGLSELIPKEDYRFLGMVAGIILIIMGGISLFKRPELIAESKTVSGSKSTLISPGKFHATLERNPGPGFRPQVNTNLFKFLLKGFIINIVNPFSLIFWVGIIAFAARNWGLGNSNVFLFLSGVFVTAFSSDILKCYLSGKLRRILAANTIHWITQAMGILFIGIGFFIIYKVK